MVANESNLKHTYVIFRFNVSGEVHVEGIRLTNKAYEGILDHSDSYLKYLYMRLSQRLGLGYLEWHKNRFEILEALPCHGSEPEPAMSDRLMHHIDITTQILIKAWLEKEQEYVSAWLNAESDHIRKGVQLKMV